MTLHFVITTLVYLLIVWPARPILLCCFVTLRTINLSITKQERGMGLAGQANLIATCTMTYYFLQGLGRHHLSLSALLDEPAEAYIIVHTDKLPPKDSARALDVKLHLTRSSPPHDHSLHVSTAGLCQVGHVVVLRYVSTSADLCVSVCSHECVLDKTSWYIVHAAISYM